MAVFLRQCHVVWPIFSALIVLMAVLGLVIGKLEGWSWGDGLWFGFVTGFTIGYGDLVPHGFGGRVLTVPTAVCGVCVTALLAAIAVRALRETFHITDGVPQPETPAAGPIAVGGKTVIEHINQTEGGHQDGPESDRDRGADGGHGHQAAKPEPADPA